MVEAIKSYWAENGFAPTLRELAEDLEIPSLATVKKYLGLLVESGRVSVVPGSPRTIRLK